MTDEQLDVIEEKLARKPMSVHLPDIPWAYAMCEELLGEVRRLREELWQIQWRYSKHLDPEYARQACHMVAKNALSEAKGAYK